MFSSERPPAAVPRSHPFLSHDAASLLPRSKDERIGQVCGAAPLSPDSQAALNAMLDDHLEVQEGESATKWRNPELHSKGRFAFVSRVSTFC